MPVPRAAGDGTQHGGDALLSGPSPTVLIPQLDLAVPTAGDDLGGLVGMPEGADAHLVVRLNAVVKLGGLPIPDVQLAIGVPRHHVAGGGGVWGRGAGSS